MKIKDILKVHYLSCVEAYFGAWIQKFLDLRMLYCESWLSWNDILKIFITSKIQYANFYGIRRIQDLAECAGIVKHIRRDDLNDLSSKKNILNLLSVKKEFFHSQMPWREDHFIAVLSFSEKNIRYINQYPLSKGKISKIDLLKSFGGVNLIFELNTQKHVDKIFVDKHREQIKKIVLYEEKFKFRAVSERSLLDALGVLRISRRRTLEWANKYIKEDFLKTKIQQNMREQLLLADKAYSHVQYNLLKGQTMETSEQEELVKKLASFDKMK